MTKPEPRPTHFLVFLLAGVLFLSLGLNAFLLYQRPAFYSDSDELAASNTELLLTQRLLAHCHAAQQQQDSVLAVLQASNHSPISPPLAGQ